jgi:hypothetical protein
MLKLQLSQKKPKKGVLKFWRKKKNFQLKYWISFVFNPK